MRGLVWMLLAMGTVSACGGPDPERVAEDRRNGFHCVVVGFSGQFVDAVKRQLRDPNSFEHEETRIDPVENGRHRIAMKFRSRNGFGGMNQQIAVGWIDHATCGATVEMIG